MNKEFKLLKINKYRQKYRGISSVDNFMIAIRNFIIAIFFFLIAVFFLGFIAVIFIGWWVILFVDKILNRGDMSQRR